MRTRRPPFGKRHAAVARRHERHRVAADRLLLGAGRDLGGGRRVVQQHDVFVDLALARERRAGLRLGIGDDEVLAARVPGLAVAGRRPAARSRRTWRIRPPRIRSRASTLLLRRRVERRRADRKCHTSTSSPPVSLSAGEARSATSASRSLVLLIETTSPCFENSIAPIATRRSIAFRQAFSPRKHARPRENIMRLTCRNLHALCSPRWRCRPAARCAGLADAPGHDDRAVPGGRQCRRAGARARARALGKARAAVHRRQSHRRGRQHRRRRGREGGARRLHASCSARPGRSPPTS